ncbi:MAG: GAP family protein [Candidatus Promineifilaceae bacterium]|nr:GAP family protein [Candidatus Promineifilaceae bacterium]
MPIVLAQSLVLAAAGLFSVGSITIIILLLMSEQGLRNGLAYLLGYVGGYMLIGLAVVLVGYRVAENSSGESSRFMPLLFVILGLLLLFLAQRNWRQPPAKNSENPRLLMLVDKITPPKALALGALVTVINFKNLALFLSAVSIPLLSELPLPAKMIIVSLDALVFCAAVILPVLVYILFPTRSDQFLNGIKRALERHSRPIGIWLPLIFGLLFLIRGISGLL